MKADYEGIGSDNAVGFVIGNKGYIGTGYDNEANVNSDFWEYNPGANLWVRKMDFSGMARMYAVGFYIGNKGYIGTGWNSPTFCKDFWAYTPEVEQSCAVPSGEITVKITANTAKLNWNAVVGAEGYKVRYKVANTNEWRIGTTDHNNKPISELLPGTKYIWQVQTFCQMTPNIISDWSEKKEFTTSSLRAADEPTMSFELYPNPAHANFTMDLQLNSSADQSADILLLNALGQIIYVSHEMVNDELKKEITIPSTASSGWYIVRVVMNDQVIEKKFLYEK